MLAGTRHQTRERRGVVLVLVLGMLGLLALIGVMFATFSGQARINARNFAESVVRAQRDELMDFALQQLITDTADARSVIRGHSLARDMFGNDAVYNGQLTSIPGVGPCQITAPLQPITNGNVIVGYYVVTNIPTPNLNSAMYGYDFTRWTMRVSYVGPFTPPQGNSPYPPSPYPVSQTFEIVQDDYGQLGAYSTPLSNGNYHVFRIAPYDAQTVLNNPTLGYITTNPINPFPGWPAGTVNATQMALNYALNGAGLGNLTFTLDGRWLHAFNGQGMGSLNVSWPVPSLNSNTTNPLSTYGNFRYNAPLLQAAGVQFNPNSPLVLTGPDSLGMDEDYDSCDLENWFLAIQSADGQVIIPSFHRPAIIRYDPSNPNTNLQANDWGLTSSGANFRALQGADSMARILRPVAADGHDQLAFKDLTPDPNTGKITYDVDNDGDGVTDSVWLDLGYPARRDSAGNLYKPLFSFMVIGLNGRIPLNTAGNLAGGGVTHAQHLGNSVSEIDPQYGLQNAYVPATDADPFNQYLKGLGSVGWAGPNGANPTANTQVDNSIGATSGVYQSIDVRLTQLRNLLAGTRPQVNPAQPDTSGTINGDTNLVWGSFSGRGAGSAYAFPNSMADLNDVPVSSFPGPNNTTLPLVQRTTSPVPGRWGEAPMIPGVPFATQNATAPAGLVQPFYANPVRAGYSFDMVDLLNNLTYNPTLYPFPREAADDDNNAFDVYPPRLLGEVGDADYYDSAGALILPVERMRRFVTPVDINGTGSVRQWAYTVNAGAAAPIGRNRGPDLFGRVQFNSYFRPAGSPGAINITSPFPNLANLTPTTPNESPYGSIAGANPTTPGGSVTNATNPGVFGNWYNGAATPLISGNPYVPDVTNNPFHGFEWNRMPNNNQIPGVSTTAPAATPYSAATLGGVPVYSPSTSATVPPPQYPPTTWPTYGMSAVVLGNGTDSIVRSDGLNEADEMNLYTPNPLLDSPYGPSDLEWLYRLQDVDGASLTSRLSQLAPVSFTNTIDGQRRRRLYSTDTWESSQFVWTPDNPGGNFTNNSYFSPVPAIYTVNPSGPPGALTDTSNASFGSLSAIRSLANGGLVNPANFVFLNGPSLAHRGKKINLNYPLPVSNDPNEPVRQKWISDTYQFLKVILPPTSVDSPEELAQLSQFVINIIDFRDPDATMTHWVNPEVFISPGSQQTLANGTTVYTNPVLTSLTYGGAVPGSIPLDQYGMEYCPVAINEVLAYQYYSLQSGQALTSATPTNRFFIELVNTQTAAYNPGFDTTNLSDPNNYYGYGPTNQNGNQLPLNGNTPGPPQQASTLDLGGFTYVQPANGLVDPYGAGCWDLVFTADNAMARPDPYRGELSNPVLLGNQATPITTYSLIPLNRDAMGTGVNNYTSPNGGDVTLLPMSPTGIADPTLPPMATPINQTTPPTTYFYVIGNQPTTISENNPYSTTSSIANQPPPVTQFLAPSFDPMINSGSKTATIWWRPGMLPGVQGTTPGSYQPPPNYQQGLQISAANGATAGPAQFFWVCLRRPANPFAPVSQYNPMCVVDSMRFPFINGSPALTTQNWTNANGNWTANGAVNTIYSAQRLQPYRGGHAVPMPNATASGGQVTTNQPPDPRYGYTEQTAYPQLSTINPIFNYALANAGGSTSKVASTNTIYQTLGYPNSSAENWDYFPFNDRDFSSVAELLLVPGCPPGLFTKQFVEFAPSQMNAANIFGAVTPIITPSFSAALTQGGNSTQPLSSPTPFATATLPFPSVSYLTATTAIGSNPSSQGGLPTTSVPPFSSLPTVYGQPGTSQNTTVPTVPAPEQPHAFPYLVDKFFYTGASTFYYTPNGAQMDPGSVSLLPASRVPVVGGPGGDGWFKMFEFFEVPSQSAGSIGTVAQGSNFDWARQDLKPGLMNVNLLIDEEAFFGIFGSEDGSYNQNLLNSIELPLLATLNTSGALTLPYNMPLSQNNYYNSVNTIGNPPIPTNGPPVPLVVSASQIYGAPNYAYPITDQTQYVEHGYLAGTDPISNALQRAAGTAIPAPGNRIKAAFAQFLWARHGGSGYVFGFGNGVTGQNSAVATQALASAGYSQATPMERPFHSLSYPDIDQTIMRPAALPPSSHSNPAILVDPNNVLPPSVYNAQALQYQPTTASASAWYLQTSLAATALPTYYAPYVVASGTVSPSNYFTGNYANYPVVYTGDPGVRNPYLNTGYVSSYIAPSTPTNTPPTVTATPPYPVYLPITVPSPLNNTTNSQYSVPPGVPLPTNVAFPMGGATPPTQDSVVMPPPIPAARLFQIPDFYGYGQMQANMYMGIINNNGTGQGNLPPAVSNAGDSGDPWINNQVANQWGGLNPYLNTATNTPTPNMNSYPSSSYTLNNGFVSLPWSGGTNYYPNGPAAPYVPATGALPPTGINYAPYSVNTGALPALWYFNNAPLFGTITNPPNGPYLGANEAAGSIAPIRMDRRQHPYWRTEMLQKAMNLTTVRTHQYAVWITVGFFQVKRQGDIAMLATNMSLAFDILGPELGALDGKNIRYRGFFIVDRLKLTGFNPGDVGAFHKAVIYRSVIE